MRISTVVVLGAVALIAGASRTPSATAGSLPERRAPMLVPKTDHEALRAQIYASFPRAEGRWGAVHVVDRTCSVSRAVIAHLAERRASVDADELVIVVDEEGATTRSDVELVHAGYRVRVIARARAAELVSVARPAMIVARPDGTLAYVGGHRASYGGFIDDATTRELVTSGATLHHATVVGCSEPTTVVRTGNASSYTARTMQ